MRDFTQVSAVLPVADMVAMLNEYLSAWVQVVFDHDGTVGKFGGDTMLAVFGSPEPDAQQHLHAVRAALALHAANRAINQRRCAANLPVCELGIGLHSGLAMHGFIGAADRLEFTVIGDAANLAWSVGGCAGPRQTLLTGELQARIWNEYWTRERTIAVKDGAPLQVWEIAPPNDSNEPQ